MIGRDVAFLAESVSSLFALVPTLRDPTANVPLGTSLPSALLGIVYGSTFFSPRMTFSAAGALVTGFTWSLIATLRSPHPLDDWIDSETTPRLDPSRAD